VSHTRADSVAADGQQIPVHVGGQDWMVSWHPPPTPPEGIAHGAEGVCVTHAGEVVLVGHDGERWDFPAGRPENGETWEQTLRREMLEEACATALEARLLGFTRGACVAGPEAGRMLVRSVWRAQVKLSAWQPRFEMPYRRVVPAADVIEHLALDTQPFAPIICRALHESSII
jgi:8-oxo-dGTP pyrophosphatase MutT (NUDIX family)